MQLLLKKGSLYKIYNHNLLYHGCIPLNEDGSFKEIQVYGKSYKGKALYDVLDSYVRKAFVAVNEEEREKGRDILWFIWSSPNSPLFGKNKMATFERYFLEAKETHEEKKIRIIIFWKRKRQQIESWRNFRLQETAGIL